MFVLYALLGFVLGAPINALADALPDQEPVRVPAYLTGRVAPRFRDAAVHVVATVLFAFLWNRYSEDVAELILLSFYTLVLLLVTVTDLEHKLIPNAAILPAIVIAALATPLRFGNGWLYALVGGLIGFAFFFAMYWFGEKMFGSGALGFGDVKLAAFVGLISSFPQLLIGLIVTLFAGGVIGFLLLITRRVTLRTAIPYGPYIVIGGFYAMVWGTEVIQWYAQRFS